MIYFIRGTLENKEINFITIDVGGIGYQIFVSLATYEKLPAIGVGIKLYISESISMYGGNTVLYGFLTQEEKEVFSLLRSVPKIGAKGALEILSKVAKSLPDFKNAILEKDIKILNGIFGISKKTAEKLVIALKEKIKNLHFEGNQKFALEEISEITDSIAALESLGYKKSQAKEAVNLAYESLKGNISTEGLIKQALRYL